jgi:hypothetical protein
MRFNLDIMSLFLSSHLFPIALTPPNFDALHITPSKVYSQISIVAVANPLRYYAIPRDRETHENQLDSINHRDTDCGCMERR